VAGWCQHGDEPSGSIRGGGSSPAERLLASQKGLCSSESVQKTKQRKLNDCHLE
jgi:hypothetical protein